MKRKREEETFASDASINSRPSLNSRGKIEESRDEMKFAHQHHNNDLKRQSARRSNFGVVVKSRRKMLSSTMKTSKMLTRISLTVLLASGLLSVYCLQSENLLGSPAPPSLAAESRAATDLPTRPQGDAFDLMVNFLSKQLNSQRQQQQQPNSFLNSQFSNNNNNQDIRRQPQQQPQNLRQPISTPANPFLAPSYQPTRRQQLSPQPLNNNNNNQFQLIASSSPPSTPYLTLNRLSNSVANQQQPVRSVQQPVQFNPPQNSNNNNLFLANNRAMPQTPMQRIPQQQQQPQRPQFSQPAGGQMQPQQTQAPPPSPFRVPPIQAMRNVEPAPMRPISGFAPSGPPPSSGLNNAMVVVQSPPNAIGQLPPPPPSSNKNSTAEDPTTAASTTTSTTTTASTSSASASTSTTTEPSVPETAGTSQQSTILIATTTSSSPAVERNEPAAPTSTDWNPVQANQTSTESTSSKKIDLAPSPDIVTVPPDYNPDAAANQSAAPQSYDISVSAQMGGSSNGPTQPLQKQLVTGSSNSDSNGNKSDLDSASSNSNSVAVREQSIEVSRPVTTIIWSPSESSSSSLIQPSKTQTLAKTATAATASRIRDNSMLNDQPTAATTTTTTGSQQDLPEEGVVYGKAQARDSKPIAPTPATGRPASIESSVAGRPYIQPVQIDNQVRPYLGGGSGSAPSASSVLKTSHGNVPFRASRPLGQMGGAPLNVGSGFTIVANGNQTMPSGDIQDYVAGQPPLVVPQQQQAAAASDEPVISAQGGPDPLGELSQPQTTSTSTTTTQAPQQQQPRIRRPTFRPRPRDPIQIDSCLPGDSSSCDQSHNEHCHREFGISSCHCRPGFGRLSQSRGYCSPVSSFQLSFKIDKLSDERLLVFNSTLLDSNNVEYQYLEYETQQALAGAMQQSSLAKQFMGVKVNKFFERRGKVWANVSLSLESSQQTGGNKSAAAERLQFVANQELAKISQQRSKPLGESIIMLDGSRESVSRLVDLDECASRELNDCAKNGSICLNEIGGFQCQCLPGYQDLHAGELDRGKHGRFCVGCPASYCSNRGECSIQADGQKQCKCRSNFMGARCDIDSEVLAVAVGGSLVGVIILIITFWCLFLFNRRWKREQQKMDAMSATSGLTFNYVNSTMGHGPANGFHRAGGHQVAGHYLGQRTLKGAGYAHQDQQAIIGSTSSGGSSSAASSSAAAVAAAAALGCNPYAPYAHLAAAAHYDESGLLISSGDSSEQTSPASASSYRAIMAGANSYTLSGHHHHHHQHQNQHRAITQFNPAAEYCADSSRWSRTMQPAAGYYLSPDMLVNHTAYHQQQMYAAPQRELCIDTGQSRKQRGRRHS